MDFILLTFGLENHLSERLTAMGVNNSKRKFVLDTENLKTRTQCEKRA